MKIILVTGASGFLGKKLVMRLLADEYKVFAISRQPIPACFKANSNVNWLMLDLAKDEIIIDKSIEFYAVFHLAATIEATSDEKFLINNELATIRLLQSVGEKTSKFIFSSTQMVYGDVDNLCVDESFPQIAGENSYACSKINCENWLRRFQHINGGQYVILRFSGFIDGGGLIDYLINQALSGEVIELYSNGDVHRDYISSLEGIDVFISTLNCSEDSSFVTLNIGSGQSVSTYELALVICEEVKSLSRIKLVTDVSPKKNFVFSVENAKKILNFTPDNLITTVKQYALRRYHDSIKELSSNK